MRKGIGGHQGERMSGGQGQGRGLRTFPHPQTYQVPAGSLPEVRTTVAELGPEPLTCDSSEEQAGAGEVWR